MKSIFKPFQRIYDLIYRVLFEINFIKTLYFNLKMLPFNQAVKLPIYIYKGVVFDSLEGSVMITTPIRRSMIRIGYNMDGYVLSSLKTRLFIKGKVIFNGYSLISSGTVISAYGTISIGNACTIGSGCFIKSIASITISDFTRITYNCAVLDSDLHYVKNIETGVVKNNKKPIVIGRNCWINAGTILSKGTILPDYSITARNSYLNKDYTELGTNLFLVGAPAKVVRTNVQRIFSPFEERRIEKMFEDMQVDEITLEPGVFDEKDDVIKLFG